MNINQLKKVLMNITALLIFIAVFIGLALIIIHVLALGIVIGLVLLIGLWFKSKLFPNHRREQLNTFVRDFYTRAGSKAQPQDDHFNPDQDSEPKSQKRGRIIDIKSDNKQ